MEHGNNDKEHRPQELKPTKRSLWFCWSMKVQATQAPLEVTENQGFVPTQEKMPQLVNNPPKHGELKNIYHHPESKKRKSSEGNSGSIHPYGRYGNAGKTSTTTSTIAILWPVKAIFEKRAATVEVDTFTSPEIGP